MELKEALLELENPVHRISDGINAVGLMAMGLAGVRDPYADGFNAIWNFLADAERDFQSQLQACLDAE